MNRRVLAISSGGGHWIQLRRIAAAFNGFEVAYASVDRAYADDVSGHRYYQFTDVTRRDRLGFLVLMFQLLVILSSERPAVLVTTGSAPALIALGLAKYVFRAKTVWIDSIANCQTLSSSGLHARSVADVWLTQWPHLAHDKGPFFWGAVL